MFLTHLGDGRRPDASIKQVTAARILGVVSQRLNNKYLCSFFGKSGCGEFARRGGSAWLDGHFGALAATSLDVKASFRSSQEGFGSILSAAQGVRESGDADFVPRESSLRETPGGKEGQKPSPPSFHVYCWRSLISHISILCFKLKEECA